MLEKLRFDFKKQELIESLVAHDPTKFTVDDLNFAKIQDLRSMYQEAYKAQGIVEPDENDDDTDVPVVKPTEKIKARSDYPAIVLKEQLPAKFNLRMIYTADEVLANFDLNEITYIAIYYGIDLYAAGGEFSKTKSTLAGEVASKHNQSLFAQTGYSVQVTGEVHLPKFLAHNPLMEVIVNDPGLTFKINGKLTIVPHQREKLIVSKLILDELMARGTSYVGTPRMLALDEYTPDLIDAFYRGKLPTKIKQEQRTGKY